MTSKEPPELGIKRDQLGPHVSDLCCLLRQLHALGGDDRLGLIQRRWFAFTRSWHIINTTINTVR